MKRTSFSVIALLSIFLFHAANADVVEIKLADAQDETRGWCVDLFAHLTNAMPLGGFQGHDCFLYFGSGPQIDQGFDEELIAESRFRLPYWDVCMTLQDRSITRMLRRNPAVMIPLRKSPCMTTAASRPIRRQNFV